MDDVFRWAGFVFLTGMLAIGAVLAWGFVLACVRKYLQETWLIVTWIHHKRGDTERAKQALDMAIRRDENDRMEKGAKQ